MRGQVHRLTSSENPVLLSSPFHFVLQSGGCSIYSITAHSEPHPAPACFNSSITHEAQDQQVNSLSSPVAFHYYHVNRCYTSDEHLPGPQDLKRSPAACGHVFLFGKVRLDVPLHLPDLPAVGVRQCALLESLPQRGHLTCLSLCFSTFKYRACAWPRKGSRAVALFDPVPSARVGLGSR